MVSWQLTRTSVHKALPLMHTVLAGSVVVAENFLSWYLVLICLCFLGGRGSNEVCYIALPKHLRLTKPSLKEKGIQFLKDTFFVVV